MSYQKEVIQLYKNNRKRATMKPKLARFAQAPALACPLCQQSLAMKKTASSAPIAIPTTSPNSVMSI